MKLTSLQQQLLLRMPTDGTGVTASQMHVRVYGARATTGEQTDRLTKAMVMLAQNNYLRRPTDRGKIGLFGNYGYRLNELGAKWVEAERKRLGDAANEGSVGTTG